nr:unnamed protein product [Meloidogyne enterolobii]
MSRIYDFIVEHIKTSKDCSKMVSVIVLNYISLSNFKLDEKAQNVQVEQSYSVKYTKYIIANKHNPTVKFFFCNGMGEEGSIFWFRIRIMKL